MVHWAVLLGTRWMLTIKFLKSIGQFELNKEEEVFEEFSAVFKFIGFRWHVGHRYLMDHCKFRAIGWYTNVDRDQHCRYMSGPDTQGTSDPIVPKLNAYIPHWFATRAYASMLSFCINHCYFYESSFVEFSRLFAFKKDVILSWDGPKLFDVALNL